MFDLSFYYLFQDGACCVRRPAGAGGCVRRLRPRSRTQVLRARGESLENNGGFPLNKTIKEIPYLFTKVLKCVLL